MTFLLEHPDILVAYREGQREALEALYHHYLKPVSLLVRLGFFSSRDKTYSVPGISDPGLQCDLIQETFLRAFSQTARRGYDGSSKFGPYLMRITKNLMIDRLRKQGREIPEAELGNKDDDSGFHLDGASPSDPLLNEENPAEAAHFATQQEACRQWIASLDESEQEFYLLRYQRAFSQNEVARRLSLTRRRIRTLETRLRDGLKAHLQAQGLWP